MKLIKGYQNLTFSDKTIYCLNMPAALKLKEVGQILRRDTQTVRRMVKDGRLRADKVGGQWMILRDIFLDQLSDGSLGFHLNRQQGLKFISESLSSQTVVETRRKPPLEAQS